MPVIEREKSEGGCHITGALTIDKVAGSLKFEYTGSLEPVPVVVAPSPSIVNQVQKLPPVDLRYPNETSHTLYSNASFPTSL